MSPNLPKKNCRFPLCPDKAIDESGYCDLHKKKVSQDYEKTRETATQRGYTSRWRRLRKLKLAKNPMCECESCREQPFNSPRLAHVVHHIDGDSHNNKWSNLMSMNDGCHNRLHMKQGDRFKTITKIIRRKTMSCKKTIGLIILLVLLALLAGYVMVADAVELQADHSLNKIAIQRGQASEGVKEIAGIPFYINSDGKWKVTRNNIAGDTDSSCIDYQYTFVINADGFVESWNYQPY